MEMVENEKTLIGLSWSARCNDEFGVGYLGPSVKRFGPLPEYEAACAAGLLRCEEDHRLSGRRNVDQMGYWITPKGRQSLAALSPEKTGA